MSNCSWLKPNSGSQMKQQLHFNQSMSKQTDHESFVELFQKGEAYQIRRPNHQASPRPTKWGSPKVPLTEKTLVTIYKDVGFFSWSPQLTPHGKTIIGSQSSFAGVTAKHYHCYGNLPVPAFSSFAFPGSHNGPPIDAFFQQSPESYKITGTETIDGRELLVVEVTVSEIRSEETYFHRAWLDMSRGALPEIGRAHV